MLIYATIEEIERLYRNRLQTMGAALPSFGSTLGAQQVDPETILQIGESIEASVDATLALIYILPIVSSPAKIILRGIICKLVVADLISVHFFASTNPQIGGDAGFGSLVRSEGIKELERYTAGYGVYYGGNNGAIPRTGNQIQMCVPLPGVPLKATSEVVRTLTPFECYGVDRDPVKGDRDYINWGV